MTPLPGGLEDPPDPPPPGAVISCGWASCIFSGVQYSAALPLVFGPEATGAGACDFVAFFAGFVAGALVRAVPAGTAVPLPVGADELGEPPGTVLSIGCAFLIRSGVQNSATSLLSDVLFGLTTTLDGLLVVFVRVTSFVALAESLRADMVAAAANPTATTPTPAAARTTNRRVLNTGEV